MNGNPSGAEPYQRSQGRAQTETQGAPDFPDLDSFPWRTYEAAPDLTPDKQPDEFLSVECIGRGH
jgi:hypothetical protein